MDKTLFSVSQKLSEAKLRMVCRYRKFNAEFVLSTLKAFLKEASVYSTK